MVNYKIVVYLVLLLLPFAAEAQNDTIKYEVGFMGLGSTGAYAPFWLQSANYGQISASPHSANVNVGFSKDFNKKSAVFDYGFKADVLLQTYDNKTKAYFHEAYLKARLSVLDLIVGAREEHLGTQDSSLSCGGFLFSKNARPMPKITLGIERFTAVPFTKGYLEVKGAVAHGWFTDNIAVTNLLLHHKYIYFRVGGSLPFHFQYGVDHVAQWGGNVPGMGQQPTSFSDYLRIVMGSSGGSAANRIDQINALGNHIISQSMKADYRISNFTIISAYWQNISEDSPKFMMNTMNKPDGLWGISIRNNRFPIIKGLVYEYLNSTDQSGPFHDKDGIVYGGEDLYFNNSIYQNGWTYFSRTIGTPFISSPVYNKNGGVSIVNSRVQVHHIGVEGDIVGYKYKALCSLSKNYGTYGASYPEMIRNTSLLLEVKKQFPKLSNIELGCSVGTDIGRLYGNSIGCMVSVRKRGNLFSKQ
jgi:hypothetical protein